MITASMSIVNIANIIPEVLEYALAIGDSVAEELASRIAVQANANAPVVSGVTVQTPSTPIYKRRGPDKGMRAGAGGKYRDKSYPNSTSSGPIKGRMFVRRSKRYDYSWLACSPTWYSHFVEFGTAAHDLKPNKNYGRKVMRYPSSNGNLGYVFKKRVRHPGTTGTRYMNRAADMAPSFLRAILQEAQLG